MFRRKVWTETNRFFTPPVSRTVKGALDTYTFMRLANGYTTVEFKDQYGNLKTEIIMGDATQNNGV